MSNCVVLSDYVSDSIFEIKIRVRMVVTVVLVTLKEKLSLNMLSQRYFWVTELYGIVLWS